MRHTFTDTAAGVLRTAPALGPVRLVLVDGPAGAGKTTFAGRLAAALGGVQVVHLDDLYQGWSGLGPAVFARLEEQILAPLRDGRPGCYRRYDWDAAAFAEWRDVPVSTSLIVEGVGAAARPADAFAALRVWVEAPLALRLRRGLERDGASLQAQWQGWLTAEATHFSMDGTRARADLVVDGAHGDAASFEVSADPLDE